MHLKILSCENNKDKEIQLNRIQMTYHTDMIVGNKMLNEGILVSQWGFIYQTFTRESGGEISFNMSTERKSNTAERQLISQYSHA